MSLRLDILCCIRTQDAFYHSFLVLMFTEGELYSVSWGTAIDFTGEF